MLTTHEGTEVRFYQDLVKGKVVLINFMYATCTDSCPTFTANLVRAQRLFGDRMGRDVFMYSISLDPEHDSPQVLRGYVQNYGVQPGWTFLTGSMADITALRRRLGLRDPDPAIDADKTQHIGVVLYGNERLDRWAACPALSEPREIVKYVGWVEGSRQVSA
jgi:protein SCO1